MPLIIYALCFVIQLRAKLRDAMQSRDLAHPNPTDSGRDASTSGSKATDTLTHLHIQGLLWALHAHQAAYEQVLLHRDISAIPVYHNDLHRTYSSIGTESLNNENRNLALASDPPHSANTVSIPVPVPVPAGTAVPASVTKQHELDHLQAIVDAAFEVCVRKGVSPTILHETLTTVAPVISTILSDFVSPVSLGPALYYKFKYFDLQSGYYNAISRHDKEYESLTFAHGTWVQMSKLHFYGTGNTVADPCKEIAVILTRMAEYECSERCGDDNMRQIGLQHVLQSVNYTATAWLPKSVHRGLLQLSHNADLTGAAESKDLLQSVLRDKFTDLQMVGVSSKVLHILARRYSIAHKCAAISTDTTAPAPINGSTEAENSSQDVRYAYLASHMCAFLRQRGEECVPEVLNMLSSLNIPVLVLGAAGDLVTEAVIAHTTSTTALQQQESDGSTVDSKRRVRLKRKKA